MRTGRFFFASNLTDRSSVWWVGASGGLPASAASFSRSPQFIFIIASKAKQSRMFPGAKASGSPRPAALRSRLKATALLAMTECFSTRQFFCRFS
jgi:hypothetical protein